MAEGGINRGAGRLNKTDTGTVRRVLKRLAGGPQICECGSDGDRLRAVSGAARGITFGAGTIAALKAADLLEDAGGGKVRLSTAGKAWLKRALSGGDGFQEQHQERMALTIRNRDGGHETLRVNLKESPLAWLHYRKTRNGKPMVDGPQFEAGERLRRDHEFGRIRPDIATQAWGAQAREGGKTGGAIDLSDAAMDARARVERALEEVGPELSGVLVDVCCYLKGLESVERERRWPARSAKIVLTLALDRLARHYGLKI
ncbi:hypothetical protein HPQ64_17130 [Rhizobiales bacterium]|uniref:DUF6456 domain-containing protein n=1 Tax=Hongsoonwoonella zoysiae TaxID=2821844 RepID=UPI0015610D73|nr:DUF6456 domain-containing protein [Hongsoonwoonella zoysiae]NRG19418.1 hypothetical protein [Hongsoonwoonella zoysiae]